MLLVSLVLASVLVTMAQDPNTKVGVAVAGPPADQGSNQTVTDGQSSQPTNDDPSPSSSSSSSSSSEEGKKRRRREGWDRVGRHMGGRRRSGANRQDNEDGMNNGGRGREEVERSRGDNRNDQESNIDNEWSRGGRRNGDINGIGLRRSRNWRRRNQAGQDQQNESSQGN